MMMTLLNPPPLDSPCHLLIVNGNNCCQQFGILGLGLPLRVEHLPSTCQALDSILGTTHTHTKPGVVSHTCNPSHWGDGDGKMTVQVWEKWETLSEK
jgi:hypothetical protein